MAVIVGFFLMVASFVLWWYFTKQAIIKYTRVSLYGITIRRVAFVNTFKRKKNKKKNEII